MDCYASFDDDVLKIGNAHIERTWRWRDGKLFASSLWIKGKNRNWIAAQSEVPSFSAGEGASSKPAFRANQTGDGPTEHKSLIVELQYTDRTLRFKIFPDSASITVRVLHPGVISIAKTQQQAAATG